MKRLIDILLSFIGLIVLMPLLVIISLLIFLTIGFPLFFSQTRLGLHGKPFTFYKLRTMSNSKNKDGKILPDKQRLPRGSPRCAANDNTTKKCPRCCAIHEVATFACNNKLLN